MDGQEKRERLDPATRALVQEVAEEAAKKAVREFALKFGIDFDDPLEFQKDTAHLRAWRRRVEQVEDKALFSFVTVMVVAVLGALWLGFKTKLGLG